MAPEEAEEEGCCGECPSQTKVLLCVCLRSPKKKGHFERKLIFGS